jgi:hypothetical protein
LYFLLLFAGLLVKENVAVSDIGMRVALICAVLSAVAYECLTVLITTMKFYYHKVFQGKNGNNLSEIENIKISENYEDDVRLLRKQVKQQIDQLTYITEENDNLKEVLEEERKGNQYLMSTTIVESSVL